MNIFFLSLSLTVKGSYIEQLIRVSDLYNFIRIRIQEIKKFVTDLDPDCTLLRIRSRIQTKRIRASKTIFKKLNYILWQKYFYIFSEYKKNIFTENKRKYECLYLRTFTFSLNNNNKSVYSQFSVGTWFSLPSDQLVLWIPHPVWSRGWCLDSISCLMTWLVRVFRLWGWPRQQLPQWCPTELQPLREVKTDSV